VQHRGQADDLDRLIGDAETARRAFQAMPLIMVKYAGADRIAAINVAFRSIVGKEHEHLVGETVQTALPDWQASDPRGVRSSSTSISSRLGMRGAR
jgi:hypothetical protein